MNSRYFTITKGPDLINPSLRALKRTASDYVHHYQKVLIGLSLLVLFGSLLLPIVRSDVYAAYLGADQGCTWYRVQAGDTLTRIANRSHRTVAALAQANKIANINLIFINQNLCVPQNVSAPGNTGGSGLQTNGAVRWYAYGALEWSAPNQVSTLLSQAAYRHGLPVNLVKAIAWQESGWNQHVIARDGGIGTMQLMPYTAQNLNVQYKNRYDPYKLFDNVELGTLYLRILWNNFGGNLTKVISAYNEGGWNVVHRGIFNWRYVNSVQALMRRF